MTAAPSPQRLATELRALADRLDTHGPEVTRRAPTYAARGFPSRTLGAGPDDRPAPTGDDTDVNLTTVESAATHRHVYADADVHWSQWRTEAWAVADKLTTLIDMIMACADPDAPRREAGVAGACAVCRRTVAGTETDPLKLDMCGTHYMAFYRARAKAPGVEFDRWAWIGAERTRLDAEAVVVHVDPTKAGAVP